MANEYWSIMVCEEKNDKKFWTKIGSAKKMTGKEGFNLYLSAHPIDRYMMLVPPRDDDNKGGGDKDGFAF